MNAYRTYWNERQINDKRLFVGALAAINGVILSALSGKLPSESMIFSSFKSNLVPRMVQTFKNGAINALQSTEKIWGGTLPPLKQITKSTRSETIAKGVSVSDLTSLGIPNDQTIIRTQCIDKIKTISSTLHGRLKKEFVESVANGEDQRQLINRIKSVQDQATSRAKRIAQTEATRLYNGGSLMGYEKSTVVSGRKWTINTFGNVRPAHRSASGQIADMGKPFIVMDEKLMFPGDPIGSPENTINCHCGVIPVIGKKPKTIPGVEKPVVPKVPSGISDIQILGMNTSESSIISKKVNFIFDSIYKNHPSLATSIKNNPISKVSLENVEGIFINEASALGNYNHNNQIMRIAIKNLGLDDSISLGKFSVGGDNLSGVIRHETGHHVYGKVLNQKERLVWEKIYKKREFKNLVSSYAGTNSSEGFSEVFSAYTSKKYIKGTLTPKIEQFMDKVLGG